jgi:hypothetical protein
LGNRTPDRALATLAWIFACPTYWYVGQAGTQHFPMGGVPGQRSSEVYHHLDGVTFFAGEIVIWAAIAGVCLLRLEIKDWLGIFESVPPLSSPSLAADLHAAAAGNPEEGRS